jgi:5-methylcytosine-specific restriction protein A
MAEPVIFVRIGWMETYQGSRTLEHPIGGGKYNEHEIGVEKDNFLPDAYGRLHGYFAVGKGSHSINLFRVDGRPETKKLDELSPVLVIFVATHHENGGGVIVGWYRNAQLYRHEQTGLNGHEFRVEADAGDAVLVPADKRIEFPIPKASPDVSALGHSNVFYLFDERGQSRSLPWAQR